MSETREERIKRELAIEARIRADAMAERTREIVAKLREPGPAWAVRTLAAQAAAAQLIERTYPEAFPKPEDAK